MKKLLITATIITLIASPMAMAKGHGKGGKHGPMKILRQLDLSDEQKQQAKTIMQQARDGAEHPSAASREYMYEQHMTLLDSATFDVNAANAFIEQQHQHKKQRQLKMLEVQHQVYQILSSEQQIQYKALTKEMMDKKMEKRGKNKK